MQIATFKKSTITQVWQPIQQVNDAFSIDIKDTDIHEAIVKHQSHLGLFG